MPASGARRTDCSRRFRNLKVIFNLGAGADHVLADPALPDLPLVRAVNPDLSMRVTEYCVLHALMFHRRQRLYDAQQREQIWKGHEQPAASEWPSASWALASSAREAAETLSRVGFKVVGWSALAEGHVRVSRPLPVRPASTHSSARPKY